MRNSMNIYYIEKNMCNGWQMHAEKGECTPQKETHDMSMNTDTCNKKMTARKMNIKMLV